MWRTLFYFYLNINNYCNLKDYLFGIFSNLFWMDFLCVYLFIFWFRFKLIRSATVFVISQYYYYIFSDFIFFFGLSLGNQNSKWTINHEIEKYIYIYIVYLRAYFFSGQVWKTFEYCCCCCCSAYCISVFIVCFGGISSAGWQLTAVDWHF